MSLQHAVWFRVFLELVLQDVNLVFSQARPCCIVVIVLEVWVIYASVYIVDIVVESGVRIVRQLRLAYLRMEARILYLRVVDHPLRLCLGHMKRVVSMLICHLLNCGGVSGAFGLW